jgi:hypothetical protein
MAMTSMRIMLYRMIVGHGGRSANDGTRKRRTRVELDVLRTPIVHPWPLVIYLDTGSLGPSAMRNTSV